MVTPTSMGVAKERIKTTTIASANMGICKSWADGSRVSTFVFQFGFISGRRITIGLCANHQL